MGKKLMDDLTGLYNLYLSTNNPQTKLDLLECLHRVQSSLEKITNRSPLEEQWLQETRAMSAEVKKDKDLASASKKNH
jgi:hypothetical protein